MLTVDFDRLALHAGSRALDMGAGGGRHAFEMLRRGAKVVALDRSGAEMRAVAGMFAVMAAAGEVSRPEVAGAGLLLGDALALPFADGSFDRVVAAEVLEHLPDDEAALAELARVLAPAGVIAVTVPRGWPERICWALSREYHEVEGGHVRIYSARRLESRMRGAGLVPFHRHHAHALHAPYWWLKCAVGVSNDEHPLVRAYHKVLVWDLMSAPRLTRVAERALNPVLGKSVVVYARKQ